MMIQITNGEAIDALATLRLITRESQDPEKRLPYKLAYWYSRLMRALADPVDAVEETRQKILRDHAEIDEMGRLVTAPNAKGEQEVQFKTAEDRATFDSAYRALLKVKIEIPFALQRALLEGGEFPVALGPLMEEPE